MMPEYVLAILRLGGWGAYVAGVFWLARMAAKRASLTAGGRRLATLLAEPLDLVLIAAVGFDAITAFFAILTAE
jgi:hypothetical protein